jgi:hypothetical protein
MDNGWNPGYWKINYKTFREEFIPYEKKWYCNHNKVIHQSEKEKNNCKHCIEYENSIKSN